MECIVTAGPTYEPIDGARRLTNFSTGQLGCALADYLAARGINVHLFLGEQATWSDTGRVASVTRFSTGADLSEKLAHASQSQIHPPIAAVFHAAAVSDFSIGQVFYRAADGTLVPVRAGKLSTADGVLLAELQPTPKIIARLRGWFPHAQIVGWKYEVDPDRQRVLSLASQQLTTNQTDASVANGPGYGPGYGVVTRASPPLHLDTRQHLFEALLATLKNSRAGEPN